MKATPAARSTRRSRAKSAPRASWSSSRPGRKARRAMLDHVATELAASMALEESVFYPGVIQGMTSSESGTAEAPVSTRLRSPRVVQHTDVPARDFRAKVSSLRRVILLHVRERENELLPIPDEEFDERDLAELGRRMKSLFFRVVEAGYRESFATTRPDALPQALTYPLERPPTPEHRSHAIYE